MACVGTIAGSGLGVLASSRLVVFRLERLERTLEKHVENYNRLAERMVVVERDLKTAFNAISKR